MLGERRSRSEPSASHGALVSALCPGATRQQGSRPAGQPGLPNPRASQHEPPSGSAVPLTGSPGLNSPAELRPHRGARAPSPLCTCLSRCGAGLGWAAPRGPEGCTAGAETEARSWSPAPVRRRGVCKVLASQTVSRSTRCSALTPLSASVRLGLGQLRPRQVPQPGGS